MNKQTFYKELTDRLTALELGPEYIQRHINQFEGYFGGKTDEQVEAEIAKLGDLDRVAARIKRMTDKVIAEAQAEQGTKEKAKVNDIANRSEEELGDAPAENPAETSNKKEDSDEGVNVVSEEKIRTQFDTEEDNVKSFDPESHGTKRGSRGVIKADPSTTVKNAPIDPAIIDKNRKKFWIIFAATSPITLVVLLATAAAFAFAFFAIAMLILLATGAVVAITAGGSAITLFGLIFGVSQMITSVPIGLYECGIAINIGAISLFAGILVYNFAVRLMPYAAKWLLVFMKYVFRKYRELFVYLKKECIGL